MWVYNIHMLINIHFVSGIRVENSYIIDNVDILWYGGTSYVLGTCWNERYDWWENLRYADIYIARQRCFYKTIKITLHEFAHAMIWVLFLPERWNVILDNFIKTNKTYKFVPISFP